MFSLFFASLIGLVVAGFYYQNEELKAHNQSQQNLAKFITSGTFVESIFENWESEFLQMGSLVVLTIWFVQKGAVDSKKMRGKMDVDTSSRYSIIHGASTGKAIRHGFYSHSLSIALFGLFLLSFVLHGAGGAAASNEEAQWHGEQQQSMVEYMASSQFWFESFQNWQSEFLSVGTLLVLSIFLRQRYSPESKPVGAPNNKTG